MTQVLTRTEAEVPVVDAMPVREWPPPRDVAAMMWSLVRWSRVPVPLLVFVAMLGGLMAGVMVAAGALEVR